MFGVPDRQPLVAPHLTDPVLLAYRDGELPQSEMQTARTHVEGCWTCRRRLTSLEESIAAFLDQKASIDPQLDPDGPQRVRQFRERLARHAQLAESHRTTGEVARDYWYAFASFLNAHRQAALASVVAACLLIAMFTDALGTRVSAETVLSRAQNAELPQEPHHGQVRLSALRLDRIERRTGNDVTLGTVTAIQDADTGMASLTSDPASGQQATAVVTDLASALQMPLLAEELPAPLVAYLKTQHWLPSVSIEAFRRLVAERGVSNALVEKDGGAFVLDYPFADGHPSGISEARLRVDRHTYAAMGLSLFVGSSSDGVEYRFTPLLASVEPRTAELARLFSVRSNPSTSRTLAAREPAKVVPLTYAATHATDEEVRVTAALHRTDACMGEEIYVFPMSDGSLLVQGLVDKSDRRQSVLQAIRSVDSSIASQIFLPRELKSGSQLFNLPYRAPEIPPSARPGAATTLADLSSQRIPLYQQLFHHFSRPGVSAEDTDQQINAFSNEAVTLARETFLHAWALKKLELQFSPERVAGLSPSTLQQIEQMRQDHRRWIATLSRRQSEMLSQVIPVTKPELTTPEAGSTDADALVRLSREQNDLVRSLFTVSSGTQEPDANLARLLSVLRRMGA